MKLAIMQPYFFPYIGYFQLMAAVDKFVVYDDVNYINKGWINRNNILSASQPLLITLPLMEASQNKKIYEIQVSADRKANEKLLRSISMNYQRAPYFNEVYSLVEQVFTSTEKNIAEFNLNQFTLISSYLGLTTQLIPTSRVYNNAHLKGEDRILDICKKEGASVYINPIGGLELYHRDRFAEEGIDLFFIQSNKSVYRQFNQDFVPWLSIIDVLMFNSPEQTNLLFKQYQLN